MISITNSSGELLKSFGSFEKETTLGLHRVYGWVTEKGAQSRARQRERHGLRPRQNDWEFQVSVQQNQGGSFELRPVDRASIKKIAASRVIVQWNNTEFVFTTESAAKPLAFSETTEDKSKLPLILVALFLFLLGFMIFFSSQTVPELPVVEEPVLVKVAPPERAVRLPETQASQIMKEARVAKPVADSARNVIKSKMGFLDLLGKKNLTKAVGGTPSTLKEASPGAGAGGTEGSGGELLVGLGEGVKKTTVGNSGVSGLGGIGTKGKGGGQGGYGDVGLSSGQGQRISQIALPSDVMIEGGLSQAVIQATIAKYLAQIRACYEDGLRGNPGLGGLVGTKFVIGGEGIVDSVQVSESTLGDKAVENCMLGKMKGWQFPKPVGGVKVRVSYPFLLRQVRS